VDVAAGQVLALDLGTSSVRGLVFDAEGKAVPGLLVRRTSRLAIDDGGRAELDPDQVVDAVGECLDELGAGGHLDTIQDVAISSAWHSVIAVDDRGRPRSGALTWADTRAAELVPVLRQRVDPLHLLTRTGALPHTTFWTVKIPWLARTLDPPPARYLGLAEYVTGRLLGEPGASISMASGTGLLDLETMTWNDEALDLAGVGPDALPELLPQSWTGRLAAEGARRWPALAEARWHPVTGDGAASNVGAGCVTTEHANINIGTSAAIRAVHDDPGAPLRPALWRYRVDDRRLVTGAAYSGAGNLWAWAKQVLRLPADGEVEAALASVPPGARGVTVMPYHAGARAPLDLLTGSGAILGLSLATTAVEIVAATLEAVCFRLAVGLEALEAVLPKPPKVVASGGAVVASPWWQQTLANVLARPVLVTEEAEASARGAALIALGKTTSPETRNLVEPQPEAVEAEREARALHEDFARRLGYAPSPGIA
jgi:gluconokinase